MIIIFFIIWEYLEFYKYSFLLIIIKFLVIWNDTLFWNKEQMHQHAVTYIKFIVFKNLGNCQ